MRTNPFGPPPLASALALALLFLGGAAVCAEEEEEPSAETIAADQAAFDDLGKHFLKALAAGDREAFAKEVLVTTDDMKGIFEKLPEAQREQIPADRQPGSEAFDEMLKPQLEKAAATFDALTEFAKENKIDLSGPLELASVEHDNVQMQGNFATCDVITVKFTTKAGGDEPFAVALRECGLVDRGWVSHGGAGWQDFPEGVLDEEARKALLVEQARNSGQPLPAGLPAPDITFIRLSDGEPETLADFRGKVVVLDFWASWCGPCQEPMSKMQTYAEKNPEWGDRVALIALSIDDTKDKAVSHLEDKGWDKSHNVWAGEGGFQSAPPAAYAIRGIPTVYIIDQKGVIHKSGHPGTMDIPEIVSALLEE
jgi:thiol-disulfide isomerase/thioredoxin